MIIMVTVQLLLRETDIDYRMTLSLEVCLVVIFVRRNMGWFRLLVLILTLAKGMVTLILSVPSMDLPEVYSLVRDRVPLFDSATLPLAKSCCRKRLACDLNWETCIRLALRRTML